MNAPVLYRRRLIPDECVPLKDDVILLCKPDLLVTGWRALKPRRDLHHGFSCYYPDRGYKISRFYDAGGQLLYHYCDIISPCYDEAANSLTVTDLLADVIVYPDGFVKVVDLGELTQALEDGLLPLSQLKAALNCLQNLLDELYAGRLAALTEPMEEFDPYFTANKAPVRK